MEGDIINSIYLDFNRVMSYDSPFLYFLIAERGVGKTYGATKFLINQFIKNKHEFVYLRRYKTDLKKSKNKFFNAIIKNNEFKNAKLEVKNDNFIINDNIAGYSMTLSTAHQIKSSNYDNVKYILFDEFLIEKGQSKYLSNEVNIFLSLIDSICRNRDIKVICLGNATQELNPYFLYFNLTLPYNNDIKLFKNNTILVNYVENLPFREFRKKTKFGQLIEGTEYADFSIDNKFQDKYNKNFIGKKSGKSRYIFSIIYKDVYYGVWCDYDDGKIYVSNDTKKEGLIFATTTNDHQPNTLLYSIANKYSCWQLFIKNYKIGNVYFENKKIQLICKDIFKNLILRR